MRLTGHRDCSGKGTPRRKVKKVHKSAGTDDKKLQTSLKKLNVQPIQAIEEVNMFKSDGNVIHFSAPKGEFSLPSHRTCFSAISTQNSNSHCEICTFLGGGSVDGHDMSGLRLLDLLASELHPDLNLF